MRFKIDNSQLLAAFKQADDEAPFGDAIVDAGSQPPQPGPVHEWMSEHSSLYAIARGVRAAAACEQSLSRFREDEPPQDAYELCVQRPNRLAYDENPDLRTVFLDPELFGRRLVPDDPRVHEGMRISQLILKSMHAKATESGSRFFVALIPTKHFVYRDLMAASPSGRASQSYARFVENEQAITDSIEKFLANEQIDFVNVTSALRNCLRQNRRPYPESDDQHLNKTGYAAIAEAMLPRINDPKYRFATIGDDHER